MAGDDDNRLTFRRTLVAPEFWLLLGSAIGGVTNVPAWVVVPLTLAGLSAVTLPTYFALWPRAREGGCARAWWSTVAQSTFNSTAAVVGAYIVGAVSRWLWW